jgi:phage minor structural protein
MDREMAVSFRRFDRWGNLVGPLTKVDSAKWTDSLDGTDTLTLKVRETVNKGDRLVWADSLGTWHEHVVSQTKDAHDSDGVYCTVTAENSICELYGDYILDKRPSGTCAQALSAILTQEGSRSNVTRWQVGTVTPAGTKTLQFYRESCRECVKDVLDAYGGELSTTIEVSGTEVTARKVNVTTRGANRGRRFTFARNMTKIVRTFDSSDVVTAMYGYGKGEEVGDGYGRRIDFSDQPDYNADGIRHDKGSAFVYNDTARYSWGRPNSDGTAAHVFGQFEDTECEDAATLLEETVAALLEQCEPSVSYSASVLDFEEYGYDFSDSQVGDTVSLIDTAEGFEVRVRGRVTKAVRDLLNDCALTSLTVGNIMANLADMLATQAAQLKSVNRASSAWDAAAYTSTSYMQQLVDRFNDRFETGGVYKYESFEDGTIYSSVPLDENMRPTTTPAKAFQLKGGGFRIADGVDADGGFAWSTMADGSGIVADSIVTGVLSDAGGKNYWNLDTGELVMDGGSLQVDRIRNSAGEDYVMAGTSSIDSNYSGIVAYTKAGKPAFAIYGGDLSAVKNDVGDYIGGTGYQAVRLTDNNTWTLVQASSNSATYLKASDAGSWVVLEDNDTSGLYAGFGLKSTIGTTGDNSSAGDHPYAALQETENGRFMRFITGNNRIGITAYDYGDSNASNSTAMFRLNSNQRLSMDSTGGLFITSSTVYLQLLTTIVRLMYGDRGLAMDDGGLKLQYDSTHFLYLDANNAYMRCGSSGFGIVNGTFSTSWTWS